MTAAELVVGRRYLLGFGPLDARVFSEIGVFDGYVTRVMDGLAPLFRFRMAKDHPSEWASCRYTTTNPERDVRELP